MKKKKRDFPYMTREDLERHRARYNTNNREDLKAMTKEQKDNKSKTKTTTNNKIMTGYFIGMLLCTSGMVFAGGVINLGYNMLAQYGLPSNIIDAFILTAIGIGLLSVSAFGLFRASVGLGSASVNWE